MHPRRPSPQRYHAPLAPLLSRRRLLALLTAALLCANVTPASAAPVHARRRVQRAKRHIYQQQTLASAKLAATRLHVELKLAEAQMAYCRTAACVVAPEELSADAKKNSIKRTIVGGVAVLSAATAAFNLRRMMMTGSVSAATTSAGAGALAIFASKIYRKMR